MLFQTAAILSLAASMTVQAASTKRSELAAAPQFDGFKVLDVIPLPNGHKLIAYGDENPRPMAQIESNATVATSCGDNYPIICDNTNEAYNWICENLFNTLNDGFGDHLNTSPRSFCQQGGNDLCCTSWANDSNDLYKGELTAGVNAALHSSCRPHDNVVSAKVYNVHLGSTCTTQCLSNRPQGCSNT